MDNKVMMIGFIGVVICCCCISSSIGIGIYMSQDQGETTYTFHQGVDSSRNDMEHKADLANNIDALKSWCNTNPKCVGFNTNGWMKSEIIPSEKWNKWTDDASKGLYVKVK